MSEQRTEITAAKKLSEIKKKKTTSQTQKNPASKTRLVWE